MNPCTCVGRCIKDHRTQREKIEALANDPGASNGERVNARAQLAKQSGPKPPPPPLVYKPRHCWLCDEYGPITHVTYKGYEETKEEAAEFDRWYRIHKYQK